MEYPHIRRQWGAIYSSNKTLWNIEGFPPKPISLAPSLISFVAICNRNSPSGMTAQLPTDIARASLFMSRVRDRYHDEMQHLTATSAVRHHESLFFLFFFPVFLSFFSFSFLFFFFFLSFLPWWLVDCIVRYSKSSEPQKQQKNAKKTLKTKSNNIKQDTKKVTF